MDLEPNNSLELQEIDALAFNNAEENEVFIRKPSLLSYARLSMHSDVMSLQSNNFLRGPRRSIRESPSNNFQSPLKPSKDRE